MQSIHTTATFDDWFSKLKDRKAFSAFRRVLIVPNMATSAIASLLVAVFRKCELTVVPATAFISLSAAWKSLSCSLAATSQTQTKDIKMAQQLAQTLQEV